MLEGSSKLAMRVREATVLQNAPVLINGSAEHLPSSKHFGNGQIVDLVVTSPPYPGVHILYHRWQVDGRRETPAPYWIANCLDGRGNAYYNFDDCRHEQQDDYFSTSLRTLRGVHAVMRRGAVIVQMIAFSDPKRQLPRYLETMEIAGFCEVRLSTTQHRRIWRNVPGRSWHADLKGAISSAREVVLVHRAS